jgi:hypothetical protein
MANRRELAFSGKLVGPLPPLRVNECLNKSPQFIATSNNHKLVQDCNDCVIPAGSSAAFVPNGKIRVIPGRWVPELTQPATVHGFIASLGLIEKPALQSQASRTSSVGKIRPARLVGAWRFFSISRPSDCCILPREMIVIPAATV